MALFVEDTMENLLPSLPSYLKTENSTCPYSTVSALSKQEVAFGDQQAF